MIINSLNAGESEMNNQYFDSIQKIKNAIAKDLKAKAANKTKAEKVFVTVPAPLPQW